MVLRTNTGTVLARRSLGAAARKSCPLLAGTAVAFSSLCLHAQLIPRQGPPTPETPDSSGYRLVPLARPPEISPGALRLIELESAFQDSVARGGGRAFGTWFAEDAVVLSNGKPAVLGRGAIAAQAQWDPSHYQLTWIVEGAQMSELADMGFTWGTYESRLTPAGGPPTTTSGRYFTVWRRMRDSKADGAWKVALDASADEPGFPLPIPPPALPPVSPPTPPPVSPPAPADPSPRPPAP